MTSDFTQDMSAQDAAAGASRGAAAYRRRMTPKQMEAEVFARASRSIREAESGDPMALARAVADNRRLWMAVQGCMIDPSNAMPAELRGRITSIALTVIRECDASQPDLAFVQDVNEQFAAGLWS